VLRNAEQYLLRWLKRVDRSPLLIRGARQVGKTYLVEQFGKQHFPQLVIINFELMPDCIDCFTSLDPVVIIQSLQVVTGLTIDPKNTLLFLDEIQDCPNAIMALRYFKEKMPALAVIAAGSLLEFTLNDESFRMPVGRVEFLYLYPLSFKEFLLALGETHVVNWIESVTLGDALLSPIHEKCLKLVKEYCLVGGMPEVVAHYVKNRESLIELQTLQSKLLQGYRLDFGKYAKTKIQHGHLQRVFNRLSDCIGQTVKYSTINADYPARDIKHALSLLHLAGLCHFIYVSSGSGIPLGANINEKKFKLLYLDTGLYLRDLRIDSLLFQQQELMLINSGILAEQFVGQQLLTLCEEFESAQLYFWSREERNSQAEVDYLWQFQNKILPIEVKSSTEGRLRSLKMFCDTYHSDYGIRICAAPLSFENNSLLSIPFYLVSEMNRLLKLIL